MMLGVVTKAPEDMLDYDVLFERWLPEGDVINDGTATILAGSVSVQRIQLTGQAIKVWLSGGIVGETCQCDVTAMTRGGRVKDVSFRIRIRN